MKGVGLEDIEGGFQSSAGIQRERESGVEEGSQVTGTEWNPERLVTL